MGMSEPPPTEIPRSRQRPASPRRSTQDAWVKSVITRPDDDEGVLLSHWLQQIPQLYDNLPFVPRRTSVSTSFWTWYVTSSVLGAELIEVPAWNWSPMTFIPYPGPNPEHGFSCQTWIGRQVNELLHPGSFYCWFSRHFNAADNGASANPMWIYTELDRAVQQGDTNYPKIKDVRTNLMWTVFKELIIAGRLSDIIPAVAQIRAAQIQMFKPQIWRLDLNSIGNRYTSGHQYPDEYLLTDLKASEFQVIIP